MLRLWSGSMKSTPDGFPKTVTLGQSAVTLREMRSSDEKAVLAFAQSLPPHDLLFISRDISNPKVVSAWVEAIRLGTIWTLLALDGDRILGTAALTRDRLSWSPHVGELRVVVAPDARAQGLGRTLVQECVRKALQLNVKKLIANMTADQKGAMAIFEEFGFHREALLKDHVIDRDGKFYDLAVLSDGSGQAKARLSDVESAGQGR